jgi:WD40 repeat protein
VQYLPDGTLICITESGIRGWLPGGRRFECPIEGDFARAIVARSAPVVALLPAAHKDEIHVFRLDMDKASAAGTILSRLLSQNISAVAISPDGNLVAAGSPAGELVLVSVMPVRILSKATMHTVAVQALAFNEDSSTLFSADAAGQIQVWQISNLKR